MSVISLRLLKYLYKKIKNLGVILASIFLQKLTPVNMTDVVRSAISFSHADPDVAAAAGHVCHRVEAVLKDRQMLAAPVGLQAVAAEHAGKVGSFPISLKDGNKNTLKN